MRISPVELKMEKETYIILRISDRSDEGQLNEKGFLGPGPGMTPTTTDITGLTAESTELDRQDLVDLHQDRNVFGTAPAIPIKLVEPVPHKEDETDPEPIEDATWGVYVTQAQASPYTGNGITVAILDTGIDSTHEAFTGIELIEEDFTGDGNGDIDGHGTHVAGTVFGQPGSGLRYSVAPGIRRALIGKVLGKTPGSTDQIFRAIQWAIDNGAMVINMSLGFDFPGYVKRLVDSGWPLQLATSRALKAYRENVRLFDAVVAMYKQRGSISPNSALIISAAGNESRRNINPDYVIDVSPPAVADGIIAVGALNTSGPPHSYLAVAPFSNINPDLCAPGMGIYSAKAGGGYKYMNGTSMASPHVAGIAALWMEWQFSRIGRIDYNLISNKLMGSATAQRLCTPDDIECVGAGLVQAPTA